MKNYIKITGYIINYLVSAALIISGVLKIVGFKPYMKMINELSPHYAANIYLLGIVAILSGILFVLPKTFIWGFIASLVFLGGTIAAHMQHGDSFIPQLLFIMLVVASAYIKKREWFKVT